MQSAFFFDGPNGRLFCTAYLSEHESRRPRLFVLLPPFGEEMNKSRHVLAAIGRALDATGHDVMLPDLHGTGDSAGDFGDASVETWRRDIDAIVADFAADRSVDLVGLRFGGLLAADAATRHPTRSLTLVHPFAQGQQQLNQLFRLRLAAGLMGQRGGETSAVLKQRLDSGETLEIAGYGICPAMGEGLQSLALASITPDPGIEVSWIEMVAAADRPLMPVSQKVIDAWQQAGVQVDSATMACDSFWATQEIAQCDALPAWFAHAFAGAPGE